MTNSNADAYFARFRRVLEHVDEHLEDELSVERLAKVAAFSKFHFHRQFSQLFGLGVLPYVRLRRLKRAAYQLAFRGPDGGGRPLSVLSIALGAGYDGPEAFARAFKKCFGVSPSEFRKQPRWEVWEATYEPIGQLRRLHMKPVHRAEDVRIVDFPETKVAALEHRGDPARLGHSVRTFIAWRKANGPSPRVSATFNIAYDDPEMEDKANFRFDICAATSRDVAPNEQGVVSKVIAGGRCAVLRHVGSEDTFPESIRWLYAEWLPTSGEDLRDAPLFFQRVSFFPDVPEHEAITDVFLPLR